MIWFEQQIVLLFIVSTLNILSTQLFFGGQAHSEEEKTTPSTITEKRMKISKTCSSFFQETSFFLLFDIEYRFELQIVNRKSKIVNN